MRNIVLLDRALDDEKGPNFDELLLRLELEKRNQPVTTIHCGNDAPPVLRSYGRDTYIEYQGCEINASAFANSDDKHRELYNEVLRERIAHPKPGLQVEEREDGIYLIYPPVRINTGQVKGAACIASNIGMNEGSDRALTLLDELEKSGATPLNSAESIKISNSKINSHKAFEQHNVPIPKTVCFSGGEGYDEEKSREALNRIGSDSFVIKGEHGYKGNRIYYATSQEEALEPIKNVLESGDGVVIQEEIPFPPPSDNGERYALRLTVLDMGDKREIIGFSNGAAWGISNLNDVTDNQREAAIGTASAAKQHVAGIDLLGTSDKPYVLETNESPSFIPHVKRDDGALAKIVDSFLDRIQAQEKSRSSCKA